MRTVRAVKRRSLVVACVLSVVSASVGTGADAPATRPALPPVPAPLNVPHPGPQTDQPYAPQPILQGGVVVTLFPPDSHFLDAKRVREPEQYNMSRATPGRVNSIVNIHNPSIEVHTVDGSLSTGAAVILAAGPTFS
jgi:endo-1,4-beta-xylanase